MALFSYTARGQDGALIRSRLQGATPDAVAAQLIASGITPIRIDEVSSENASTRAWTRGVALEDLIAFTRQMGTLIHAGVPIVPAINSLSEGSRNPTMARVLTDVTESLRSGRELSLALERHSDVFPRLLVSMVQVGENTGRLDSVFRQISRYLELERETRNRIKTALRYPALVLGAVALAMILINLLVIPVFAKTFRSFGAELPWATQILIAVSDFTVKFWPWMLFGSIGAALCVRAYLKTDAGRALWDTWKLRIPIVGSIINRATLGRYARAFAMTFDAGVPMNRTLEVVARAVDNAFVCGRVGTIRNAIERGETLVRAAAASELFTPLVLQMISVGEQTGSVVEMHEHIAGSYEDEVEYDLRRLSDLLEPLLIVGLGVVVLILALGVYLPMWDLSSAVRAG